MCRGDIAGASDVDWKEKYDALRQYTNWLKERNEDYRHEYGQQQEIIEQQRMHIYHSDIQRQQENADLRAIATRCGWPALGT